MNRRALFAGLIVTSIWPHRPRAQPKAVRRLGVLATTHEADAEWKVEIAALLGRLRDLGWIDGQNLAVDFRFGMGDVERLAAGAKELASGHPDIILARSTRAVQAVQKETKNTSIVFVSVADPVGEGLAASFARPGGNITGFTNVEAGMGGKWLQLLREMAPKSRRVAVLFNADVAVGRGEFFLRPMKEAANRLDLSLQPAPVQSVEDIERVLSHLGREPDSGIVTPPDLFIVANRRAIIEMAARYMLPTVFSFRNMAAEGGLLSYGVDVAELYRRSGDYIDRIFRGTLPGDLPIQGPTRFQLAVNLKTARALGLTIPASLLAQADEVIE
jgi:putative ABC transport system substrate-binding protein